MVDISKCRTQKAKGIMYLAQCHTSIFQGQCWNLTLETPPDVRILPHEEPFVPAFVRPCPIRPRHGFVESQLCKDWRQVSAMVHALAMADPEGEIVFQPPLLPWQGAGKYSAIANSAGLTIGLGNDGATSGKAALFIPVHTSRPAWRGVLGGPNLHYAGIEHSPYMELVSGQNNNLFVPVQLRDGPDPIAHRHYIPKKVKVEHIYRMGEIAPPSLDKTDLGVSVEPDELLVWEKLMLEASKKEGAVAHLPGHSLASHFAIHAIVNEVPVWTETMLAEGQVLTPAEGEEKAKQSYPELADFVAYWLTAPMPKVEPQLAALIFSIAHSHATWDGVHHLTALRGLCVGLAARLLLAACIGEARHFYAYGPGQKLIEEMGSIGTEELIANTPFHERVKQKNNKARLHTVPWEIFDCHAPVPEGEEEFQQITSDQWKGKPARETVFQSAFKIKPAQLLAIAPMVAFDLAQPGWAASYGGAKWHISAREGEKLLALCLAFVEKPSADRWAKLASQLNIAINAVHNGGRLLSKWVHKSALQIFATAPICGLASPACAEACFSPPSKAAAKKARQALKVQLAEFVNPFAFMLEPEPEAKPAPEHDPSWAEEKPVELSFDVSLNDTLDDLFNEEPKEEPEPEPVTLDIETNNILVAGGTAFWTPTKVPTLDEFLEANAEGENNG